MHKQKIKLKKDDYIRVIISETIPYEVPIIFSNEGFYYFLKNNVNSLIFNILFKDKKSTYTIPLSYNINNNDSIRQLCLIHPISQIDIIGFYKKFHNLICNYTSISNYSIRAPEKVGASYYIKSSNSNINKYKESLVDTDYENKFAKYPSSFFSYRGYNRLHKFINSEEFFRYEKQFNFYGFVDISKCFSSIYTHSLAWAIKSKDYVKKNLNTERNNNLGNEFDKLMQKINYNETNGIIIGPEISRIFSEVLFQNIDVRIYKDLENYKLKYENDYIIKRYVDDYYIFVNDSDNFKIIINTIKENLLQVNLHLNDNKTITYTRPFYTVRSKLIHELNAEIKILLSKLYYYSDLGKINLYKINRISNLKLDFIKSIKNKCIGNQHDFPMASSYIISTISNQIDKLHDGLINNNNKEDEDEEDDDKKDEGKCIKDIFLLLIQIQFYMYTLFPTVSSSYKICRSILIIKSFFENKYKSFQNSIKEELISLSCEVLKSNNFKYYGKNTIPLEKLNLLLAISDFGNNFMLPKSLLKTLFKFDTKSKNLYFEIMVALYYLKNNKNYKVIKQKILTYLDNSFRDLKNIKQDSVLCYLFLDSISCPYIDKDKRKEYLENLLKIFNKKPNNNDLEEELNNYQSGSYLFINWEQAQILNCIEKKEVIQVYSF